MKAILSIIISGALVVSGYAQTRNVLVGTNNTVVQPTNFWSADASNARTGLGLGTAATNDASAFQPSSATLSNLASSNAVNLTNLRATNLVGLIPTSNIPSTTLTNISGTLAVTQGGTGATNIGNARTNLGATSIGDAVFTATNAATARTAIGALATNGDATNLTNFPANLLRTNGNGSGLANLTAANITGTVGLASNVTGTVAISNGGTGATNAGGARTNLGLGATNNVFVGLLVGTQNTNLSTNDVSLFGQQNYADSSARESFAFGAANSISNMPAGAGGSIVMGVLGNMTNQGAFLFNGVPQGGTVGNSRGNNTFAVNASNGIYLNGSLFLESVQGVATDSGILAIGAGGVISRTMTNKSTAVPAFFGWDGFVNTAFSAAQARTNIGLTLSALTNTNTSGFNASLYGTGTNPVLVNTNGEVVSPTNFWQEAPITTTFIESQPTTNSSTNISPSRLLHIHSLSTNVVNTTNTIILPTNALTFEGDMALVVHKGPTNSLTQVRQDGSTNNLITLNKFNEAVEFTYYNNTWQFLETAAFTAPIYFSGTNAAASAAASRTNLGLGTTNTVVFGNLVTGSTNSYVQSAFVNLLELRFLGGIQEEWDLQLTEASMFSTNNGINPFEFKFASGALFLDYENDNTIIEFKNDTNAVVLGGAYWNHGSVRTSLGLGATNNVTFNDVTASGTLTATSTVTAKTNLVVEGFVDFTTNRTNSNPATNNQINDFIEIRIGTNQFWLPVYK